MNALAEITFDPRQVLVAELERRKRRNARYSLRGFAADLGVDAAQLSKILAGKAPLSVSAAQKVARALGFDDGEANQFIESAAEGLKRRVLKKDRPEATPVRELDADAYALISDMHHFLILEATFLEDFESDARWLAKRLGKTVIETEHAMARLVRLGLLRQEGGTLKKVDRHVTTSDKQLTTPALKDSQQQILRATQRALVQDSLETRSTTGMSMAIDPEKIPVAKRMIQSFMEQLCTYLESGERKAVYQLSVSLFSGERNF